ncbi:MAG: triose-phosphate isomerase [Chloroflexi bacterium RBG_19FT_COMBO_62_14]|nr:MAG: triose-phosphate isomerase [Chloroflexi bacterium RBG_19FT_COMBO_62_14]
MRTPVIAGNWKMYLGQTEEALGFVRGIRQPLNEVDGVERVLCPPFTVLATVAEVLQATRIEVGAQTMHWEDQGAHTGEVSPRMLQDLCKYVIIGHSERRAAEANAETDAAVNKKVRAALAHGLIPILCVGENLAQNEAGQTEDFVGGQVRAALEGLGADEVRTCVIAYEPIWAIGTGKAATPADANRVMGVVVRGAVSQQFGEEAAQAARILYGGSVNVENIAGFMSMPEIDGALVGGASLKPDFVELVRRAAATRG